MHLFAVSVAKITKYPEIGKDIRRLFSVRKKNVDC